MVSCTGNGAQMRQQLEALEQQNRSGEQMLNDSLAESLVSYFDKHGSANERMRAKYILGRTYYCLGELPRALETYYEAADCADTTATDCNYKVLSRVYGQSSAIYYDQVQPRSQLEKLKQARYFAMKAKDTLAAVEYYAQMAESYKLLSLPDSVIIITMDAHRMFKNLKKNERAHQVLGTAISSLVKLGKLKDARSVINNYESKSGYFDEWGNVQKGREVYYYLKGEYYLAINEPDSAEYVFRKELCEGKDYNNQIAGSKGLQEVFVIKKNSDSIAKYANLGYELNDSAYSLSEMQNIQKLQASYNYNHNKQIADENRIKAERLLTTILIIIVIVVMVIWLILNRFSRYKETKEKELKNYMHDLEVLESLQTELQEICSEDSLAPELIFEKKQRAIVDVLGRISAYRRRTKPSKVTVEESLIKSSIMSHLRSLVNSNPYEKASLEDFRHLRELINILKSADNFSSVRFSPCL